MVKLVNPPAVTTAESYCGLPFGAGWFYMSVPYLFVLYPMAFHTPEYPVHIWMQACSRCSNPVVQAGLRQRIITVMLIRNRSAEIIIRHYIEKINVGKNFISYRISCTACIFFPVLWLLINNIYHPGEASPTVLFISKVKVASVPSAVVGYSQSISTPSRLFCPHYIHYVFNKIVSAVCSCGHVLKYVVPVPLPSLIPKKTLAFICSCLIPYCR